MGKINQCLKVVFIVFNSLFTCLGVMSIIGLLRNTATYATVLDGHSIAASWAFALGMLLISVLGSHAARTENKTALKVFAGFMVIGTTLMLIFGIIAVVMKSQVQKTPEYHHRKNSFDLLFNIAMGLNFGFAFIALMGLILACTMVGQISDHDIVGGTSLPMRAFVP